MSNAIKCPTCKASYVVVQPVYETMLGIPTEDVGCPKCSEVRDTLKDLADCADAVEKRLRLEGLEGRSYPAQAERPHLEVLVKEARRVLE